ncbi:hypothetical protein Tco_0527299 [Tanacetum coccineum]
MAAHTERMEWFEEAIFKQREEINDRMAEMFGLLCKISLPHVKEGAKKKSKKNSNRNKIEKEKNTKNDEVADKNVIGLSELNAIEPNCVVDIKNEVVDGINVEPVRNVRDEPEEEQVEMPKSQLVGYYLKHEINENLIEGLFRKSEVQ